MPKFETLERAKKITDILYQFSNNSKVLAEMESQNREEYYFSNGWCKMSMDKELAGKLITVIKEHYKEQAEKLEKEFEDL